MFSAYRIDTKEIIYANEFEKEILKDYCNHSILECPDCGSLLNVRSGSKKQHFYHVNSTCSYKYHEPESEEHEEGKLLLRDRLIELFPEAVVTMEKRVSETNQRSDVLVEHENGEVWAFEFQCSVITADTWAERHYLYEKAGIIDFWVLGESIHSYGISDKREDKLKHRLGGLEKAIFEKYKRVHYLDTASGKMRILGQFKYELLNTILKCRPHYNMLRKLTIRNHTWWTSEDAWEEELRQKKEHERRYKTDPAYKAEYDKMIHDKYFKPATIEDFLEVFPNSYIVSSDNIKIINEDEKENE